MTESMIEHKDDNSSCRTDLLEHPIGIEEHKLSFLIDISFGFCINWLTTSKTKLKFANSKISLPSSRW